MKRYEIPMSESRCYSTTYWVDARNPEEALEKALIGDTVDEDEGRVGEIIDREAVGDAKFCSERGRCRGDEADRIALQILEQHADGRGEDER